MTYFFQHALIFFTSYLFAALSLTTIVGGGLVALGILAPAWLPVNRTNVLWAGAIILVSGWVFAWVFEQGQEYQSRLFAARDRVAVERNQRAQQNLSACNDALDWDVVTGTCKSATK